MRVAYVFVILIGQGLAVLHLLYFLMKHNFERQWNFVSASDRFIKESMAREFRATSHDEDIQALKEKLNLSERLVTAKPPLLNAEDEMEVTQGSHQGITEDLPFIPYGPDESPVGKPARIPKKFLIKEANYCKRHPGLDIIAYVHSAISRVKRRETTRATWAYATAQGLGVKLGVVFMVGNPKNEMEREIVRKESAMYHDIVQGEYPEDYRLLTYKGLASLYWISNYCPDVPWTMHADDDVHIDIIQYFEELQKLNDQAKERFICRCSAGQVLRSERWKVSYEEYPYKFYPIYCSGGMWAIQTKHIPRLLEASKTVPFLWVDDAYITGLLAKEAGIKHYSFGSKYGTYKQNPEVDLGSKVWWYVLPIARDKWWKTIVEFHRNKTKDETADYHSDD